MTTKTTSARSAFLRPIVAELKRKEIPFKLKREAVGQSSGAVFSESANRDIHLQVLGFTVASVGNAHLLYEVYTDLSDVDLSDEPDLSEHLSHAFDYPPGVFMVLLLPPQ